MIYRLTMMALVLCVAACAAKRPVPEAGMQVIEHGRHGEIQFKDGVDWSRYTKIRFDRATVEFRENWIRDQRQRHNNIIRENDEQRIKAGVADLLEQVLVQAFTEQGDFQLAEADGADVMHITPRITKLDIIAPDRVRNHIGYSLTDSQGSFTVELETRDPVSGDLLFSSRHDLRDPQKGYMVWTTSVTNRHTARMMLSRWSGNLREWLVETRETGQS